MFKARKYPKMAMGTTEYYLWRTGRFLKQNWKTILDSAFEIISITLVFISLYLLGVLVIGKGESVHREKGKSNVYQNHRYYESQKMSN